MSQAAQHATAIVQRVNFVIDNLKGGGVTKTAALDIHGKSLSSLMLAIPLPGNEPDIG